MTAVIPATSTPTRPRGRSAPMIVTVAVLVSVGLLVTLGVAYGRAAANTAGDVTFARALAVPPLAESRVEDGVRTFALDLREGTTDFGQAAPTPTIGVNGSYLGPTIRAERGEKVRFDVTNSLGETSTLHWHGVHLPPAMDGGPHQMIEPGHTWSPTWTVDQPAATAWYHPHLHGATADQVYRGLAGVFLIDDPDASPASRALPHDYGVDDIPVVVQDKTFRPDGSLDQSEPLFSTTGTRGSTILVNGTPGPYFDVTTERVRLRVLNGSNARIYNVGFVDRRAFDIVASDSGLLTAPINTDHIQVSPGDRVDIVVELKPGERVTLRSFPPDLGVNPVTSRFAGGADTLDIMELRAAKTLAPRPAVPARLSAVKDQPTVDESRATKTRRFDLSGSSVNGKTMDMDRIDEVVQAGDTEIWEVTGLDDTPHNFHIHDVRFTVLDVGGRPPPVELRGPQDTVYVRPGRVTRLLITFTAAEGATDPTAPYMFHCHLLRHEDQGMMGQFVITDPGSVKP